MSGRTIEMMQEFTKAQQELERRKQINSWVAIGNLPRPDNQNICVYTYLLNDNPKDSYGFVLNLGNYKTKEEAEKRVQEVIDLGHKAVFACEGWAELYAKLPKDAKLIKPNMTMPLYDAWMKEQEENRKRDEANEKYNKELTEELEKRLQPDTFEHYLNHVHKYVICALREVEILKQLEECRTTMNKHLTLVKTQMKEQPEMDKNFAKLTMEKLKPRNEEQLATHLIDKYSELQKKL